MSNDAHSHHVVPYNTHVKIWIALLVLTVITVWVAGIHLGVWNGVVAFLIATLKAGLVLAVFMHLKYEESFFRLMLGLAVVTLMIIFSLTFSDYAYR